MNGKMLVVLLYMLERRLGALIAGLPLLIYGYSAFSKHHYSRRLGTDTNSYILNKTRLITGSTHFGSTEKQKEVCVT